MRNFTNYEVLNLNERQIEDLIISNAFEFETNSKDSNKEVKFNALVLDQSLGMNGKPFDLQILIEGETKSKDLSIINIKSIKYID